MPVHTHTYICKFEEEAPTDVLVKISSRQIQTMWGWVAGEKSALEIRIRVWLHFTLDMQFDQIEMPLGKSMSREKRSWTWGK